MVDSVVYSTKFTRQVKKLHKKNILDEVLVKEAVELFMADPKDHRLRPHKIICKKDKHRFSLSIPNTPYRLLYTYKDNIVVFQYALNHSDYDRINKDC
jgi:mRNA-degrading endonuclease YafQ of YafQ-DinJ toxin-antitoxin module